MTINEVAEQILRVFGYGREPDISVPTEVAVRVGMRERVLPILRQLEQTEYQRGYLEAINKKEVKDEQTDIYEGR